MTLSVAQAMAGFSPALPLAVAYSGGADSTALLLACADKWPGQVRAIHIHHGLQAAADQFEQHCQALCARLQVPLQVCRVNAQAAQGQSPEDAARRARYQAFAQLAREADGLAFQTIALAQHADDQVETLLLALSRGSGLAGLSAMPAAWTRDGIQYARPLLRVAGADLRAWLQQRGETWVEDPTNVNEQFTRNRIRARLLPALAECFPQWRDTMARSADHAAQAQSLLDELAAIDLHSVGVPPQIQALQTLSAPRQANVLRHWLKTVHQCVPSTAQLDELQAQVADCVTRGHQLHIKVGAGFVQREGAGLAWYNP